MLILRTFVLYSLFLLTTHWASAQIEVSNIPPLSISPCGPDYEYTVIIRNPTNNPLNNYQLTYDLYDGLSYIPGSIDNPSVSEGSLSDPNAPVFNLGTIGVNEELRFRFSAHADCSLLPPANPTAGINDTLFLLGNATNLTIPGAVYNYRERILNLLNCQNLDEIVSIGDTIRLSCTVQSSSIIPVTHLFVDTDLEQNAFRILSVSTGNLQSGNIQISGSDFNAVGDGDLLFDQFEQFDFEIEVVVEGCIEQNSTLDFSYGCADGPCSVFASQPVQLSISNDPPDMDLLAGATLDYPDLCGNEGIVEYQFINKKHFAAIKAVPLINFNVELGWSIDDAPVPQRDDCLPFSGFQIGNRNIQVSTFNTSGYKLRIADFLTSDPDGPGGLQDLDKDGFFDDLAAGDTINLRFRVNMENTCFADNCLQLTKRAVFAKSQFSPQCRPDRIAEDFLRLDEYVFESDWTEIPPRFSTMTLSEDSISVSMALEGSVNGFDENCPNGTYVFNMIFQDGLDPGTNFIPTFNDIPAGFQIRNDSLRVFLDSLDGIIRLPFLVECDTLTIITNPSDPCVGSASPGQSYNISHWVEYVCDILFCPAPVRLNCDTSLLVVPCPVNTATSGTSTTLFSITRTTSSLDSTTSEYNGLIRFPNVAMLKDNVLARLSATLRGQGDFASGDFIISYDETLMGRVLEYISDTLRFKDASSGMLYRCSLGLDSAYTISGRQELRFSIQEAFASGGCLANLQLDDQDELDLYVYAKIGGDLPNQPTVLDNLRGRFTFELGPDSTSCGSSETDILRVFDPFHRSYVDATYENQGCGPILLTYYFEEGTITNGEDYFEQEFRPKLRMDSIIWKLPLDGDYVPGSAFVTNILSPDTLWSVPIPDPQLIFGADTLYLKFNQADAFPRNDYRERNDLRFSFEFLPGCLNHEDSEAFCDVYYTDYYYNIGCRETKSILNTRVNTSDHQINGLELEVLTPIQFTNGSDTLIYKLSYCLDDSLTWFVPDNWLEIQLPPSSNIQVLALREQTGPNTFIDHPILPTANNNLFWAQIGDLVRFQCKTLELIVSYDACTEQQFSVAAGWQCGGYPTAPDALSSTCPIIKPGGELQIIPSDPVIQVDLSAEPQAPLPLCEPLPYTIVVFNGGEEDAQGLEVEIEFSNDGIVLLPGSMQVASGNGNFSAIPDPDPIGPNRFRVNLRDSLLAGLQQSPDNLLFISFEIELTCDYVHPGIFSLDVNYINNCGEVFPEDVFFNLPFQLAGAPSNFNSYASQLSPTELETCASEHTLSINVDYTDGALGQTNAREQISLTLAEGFSYLPGSFRNLMNIPGGGDPVISFTPAPVRQVLNWGMPPGLVVGSQIAFEIDISPDNLLTPLCDSLPFEIEVSEINELPCSSAPGGSCAIKFINHQEPFILAPAIPALQLNVLDTDVFPFDQNGSQVAFEVGIQNNSVWPEQLVLNFYYDSDGNGQFDPSLDQLLGAEQIATDTLSAGSALRLRPEYYVPLDQICDGFFVVLQSEDNPCLCSDYVAYVDISLNQGFTLQDTICLADQHSIAYFPSQPGVDYEWLTPEYLDNPAIANPRFEFTGTPPVNDPEFIVKLILRSTLPDGCTLTDTINLLLNQLAIFPEIIQPVSCQGEEDASISIGFTQGLSPYSFDWGVYGTNAQVDSLGAGSYAVTVTDAQGCTAVSIVEVTEPPVLEMVIQLTDFNGFGVNCNGDSNGEAIVLASGGTAPYTYLWSNGPQTITNTDLSAGTYQVTVEDANGCTLEEEIDITEPAPIELILDGIPPTCFGEEDGSITIISPTGTDYLNSLNGSPFSSTTTYGGLAAGTYEVAVQEQSSGCTASQSIQLDEPPELLVSNTILEGEDGLYHLEIIFGDSILIPGFILDPNVTEFWWEDPDSTLSCTLCLNPVARPVRTTVYVLHVVDENGCITQIGVKIEVIKEVYFPNIFTPNGDGINDGFTGFGRPSSGSIEELWIFSRWGEFIYRGNGLPFNVESLGWDGTFKGEPMNPGVFAFIARVVFVDGEVVIFKGDVTLVR